MKYFNTLVVLFMLVSCGPSAVYVDQRTLVPGPQGPTGTNGQDANPVTVVTFCPGTTTYPSAFLEVGLCLNNQVYGVYSANSGFMTLLPPGAYNSNAVGSNCNFTILSNCVVQH